MKLLLLILFIQNAYSAVIKNEVGGLKRKAFTLKEACIKAGFKDNLLVEASNSVTIDCMGRELNINDFCTKLNVDPNLLRGFVSKSKSQVYCEYGTSVSLTLSCDKDHFSYCQNAKKGCEKLGQNFAIRLSLMHSSLTGVPKNINCHFSTPDPTLFKDL